MSKSKAIKIMENDIVAQELREEVRKQVRLLCEGTSQGLVLDGNSMFMLVEETTDNIMEAIRKEPRKNWRYTTGD